MHSHALCILQPFSVFAVALTLYYVYCDSPISLIRREPIHQYTPILSAQNYCTIRKSLYKLIVILSHEYIYIDVVGRKYIPYWSSSLHGYMGNMEYILSTSPILAAQN